MVGIECCVEVGRCVNGSGEDVEKEERVGGPAAVLYLLRMSFLSQSGNP